jgi:hypothetical protein
LPAAAALGEDDPYILPGIDQQLPVADRGPNKAGMERYIKGIGGKGKGG